MSTIFSIEFKMVQRQCRQHWWGESSVFSLIRMRCMPSARAAITMHQQTPPVVNWRCRLMQVDLYDGHKTVAVVDYYRAQSDHSSDSDLQPSWRIENGTDQFMGESGPHSLTPYVEFTKHVTTGTAQLAALHSASCKRANAGPCDRQLTPPQSTLIFPSLTPLLLTHTHTLCLGLPKWAGTRKVKPNWILLKQETVSGSGISWVICKSAPRSRQITMPAPHDSVFYSLDAVPAAQPTASKHRHQNPKLKTSHNVNGT